MEQTVLVPVDGSPLSWRALRHALEQFPESEIVVLHVTNVFEPTQRGEASIHEPMIGSDKWHAMEQQATEQLLAEAEEIAADYDRSVRTDSELGDPQRLIPDYTREGDIDHVVIGVHGREEQDRSLFGRVAESVVFRSPVSVTVIR
jgi:nucleotide-binding universal stress UspA family protein